MRKRSGIKLPDFFWWMPICVVLAWFVWTTMPTSWLWLCWLNKWLCHGFFSCGGPGRIRTGGHWCRRPALFPAELRIRGTPDRIQTCDTRIRNPVLCSAELQG